MKIQATGQQKNFILFLLEDPTWNAANAAKKAGYKNPSVMGTKLLKNPRINDYLEKVRGKRETASVINQERILEELACIGFRDPIDLVGQDGLINTSDLAKLPKRIRLCIDSFKVRNYYDQDGNISSQSVELRMVPKLGALEIMNKMKGYYVQKVDVDVKFKPPFKLDSLYGRTDVEDPIETTIARVMK